MTVCSIIESALVLIPARNQKYSKSHQTLLEAPFPHAILGLETRLLQILVLTTILIQFIDATHTIA